MSKELLPAVAKKYEVTGIKIGKHYYAEFGEVDFEKISLPEADQLYKAKFPHLVLKKKQIAPASV
ncbi:hypothetical protein ACVWYN_002701 [Pedobacter sp. UYP24]